MLPQSLIKVLHQSATAGLLLVLLLAGSGAARAERIKDIAEGLVVAMREDLDTDNVWHTFSMSTRRLWPIARSSDFTRMWGGNMGAINDVQSLDLLQEGQGSAAP